MRTGRLYLCGKSLTRQAVVDSIEHQDIAGYPDGRRIPRSCEMFVSAERILYRCCGPARSFHASSRPGKSSDIQRNPKVLFRPLVVHIFYVRMWPCRCFRCICSRSCRVCLGLILTPERAPSNNQVHPYDRVPIFWTKWGRRYSVPTGPWVCCKILVGGNLFLFFSFQKVTCVYGEHNRAYVRDYNHDFRQGLPQARKEWSKTFWLTWQSKFECVTITTHRSLHGRW